MNTVSTILTFVVIIVPVVFLAQGTSFVEEKFSMDQTVGDSFGMIQAHYIYCVVYLYFYYVSSTLDHHALDPEGWGPLSRT